MATNDSLRQLVLDCCRDHNEISDRQIDLSRDEAAALFGVDGALDSISLVSLILAVEQGIEDRFGVIVTLADAKAASQSSSPFRTIGSLVEYAGRRIEEASSAGV